MLEIVECGALVAIQDEGRPGWRRFGVPTAGPMDAFAFEAARMLAGNNSGTTALEIGGGDVVLRAQTDCVIAVTGAGYELTVNIWQYPLWGSYFVRAGWLLRLIRTGAGMWAYLAIPGGFAGEQVLGSRSTYLRGKIGGKNGAALQAGDVLLAAEPGPLLMELAGRTIATAAVPVYGNDVTVGIIPGPQADRFEAKSLAAFLENTYAVSLTSDRMGYRLDGTALTHKTGADITSEGMTPGAVQVPADGKPIVMMADCPTTGGYTKIGCVIRADLPLLAQCAPGSGQVRFRSATIEAAHEKYRAMMAGLRGAITEPE